LEHSFNYNSPPDTFIGPHHVGKGPAGSSTHLINLIHETRKRGYP
jgi:hypothetical protein